jgi:Na+/melibiose symporter-like transporter
VAFADRTYRRLLAVFVVNGIAAALPATLFLFFVADVLRSEQFSGLLLGIYFVSGALSLPLWVAVAAWHGRVRAWMLSMVLAVVTFACAGMLREGDILYFALICLMSGTALGADLVLPAAIAADLGERKQRAGIYFGVWNFVAKMNLALAAGIVLPLLGWLGYTPGLSASTHSNGQYALVFAYALLPLFFKALAFALLWRWRASLEVDV